MKTCPKCALTAGDDATTCQACGHGFSTVSLTSVFMLLGCGVLLVVSANSLIASLPKEKPEIVEVRPVSPFPTRNAFAETLPTLAGPARASLLGRLMTKSGQPCATVERSYYLGSRDGMAYWNIRCDGSGDWMVQVKNDSSITRVACNDHPQIKAQCWKPM